MKIRGVIPGIVYYVDNRFASSFARNPKNLFEIESEVENHHGEKLKFQCRYVFSFFLSLFVSQLTLNDRVETARKEEAMKKGRKNEAVLKE